jgi:hypothetical protein
MGKENDVLATVQSMVEKAMRDDNIELEVRMGSLLQDGRFAPGVSKEQFNRVLEIFHSSLHPWTSVQDWSDSHDHTSKSGGLRITTSQDGKRTGMCKNLIERIDLRVVGDPVLAVRLSLKEERPVVLSTAALPPGVHTERAKRRKTFVDGMWQYDFTNVHQKERGGQKSTVMFEIELEAQKDRWNDCKLAVDVTHSLLVKTQDVIQCIQGKNDTIPVLALIHDFGSPCVDAGRLPTKM